MSEVAANTPRVVIPQTAKWPGRLAVDLAYYLVCGVAASLRFQVKDAHRLLTDSSRGNVIFCIWHNRLALAMPVYRRFTSRRPPGFRLAAMVSASKDGGLLARFLAKFDVEPVRGSSSRRGAQALLELTTWAERGYDLAITPDGPRGPRYVVQDGVMALAQLTGLPIIPTVFNVGPKICLRSWDAFQVPLPLGQCEVIFGEPLRVARDISEADRLGLREELESRLRASTRDS